MLALLAALSEEFATWLLGGMAVGISGVALALWKVLGDRIRGLKNDVVAEKASTADAEARLVTERLRHAEKRQKLHAKLAAVREREARLIGKLEGYYAMKKGRELKPVPRPQRVQRAESLATILTHDVSGSYEEARRLAEQLHSDQEDETR